MRASGAPGSRRAVGAGSVRAVGAPGAGLDGAAALAAGSGPARHGAARSAAARHIKSTMRQQTDRARLGIVRAYLRRSGAPTQSEPRHAMSTGDITIDRRTLLLSATSVAVSLASVAAGAAPRRRYVIVGLGSRSR